MAARHLARADARRAAIIGTGHYASAQLQCLASVRELDEIRCYSRDQARLQAFVAGAAPAAAEHARGRRAVRRAKPREGADIVTTITTSAQPVVEGAWLAPGSHCNAMGQHAPAARELDSAAIVGARVIVDARAQALRRRARS